jgi:hypothetical protein
MAQTEVMRVGVCQAIAFLLSEISLFEKGQEKEICLGEEVD